MTLAVRGGEPALIGNGKHRAPWRASGWVLVVALLVSLAVAGCTSSGSEESDDATDTETETESTERPDRSEFKPTIRLAVTDWTAARLNVSIAEQLIERRLGYPVEPVEIEDTQDMLEQLAVGELDAVLEVWPSSLDERNQDMLDSGRVEGLGELGVVGQTGWFVPRYVLDENPELATWEPLADTSVASDFASVETAPRGRFLGTDLNYEQFDEEIIAALDLPFEVVFSGSDEATATELSSAARNQEPVLLFWWTPTAEITEFDLVKVALPPRTADCEAKIKAGEPQDCDYPTDRIIKIASPTLANSAPNVHQFIASLALTNNDQLQMIHQVEMDGRSVDEVAAAWIAANEDRWNAWLP